MPGTDEMTLDVTQSIDIDAAVEDAYAALLRRLTHENTAGDNQPMPMVLEQWPGGRWFRDLGNNQGHLWGFVQVIKPPTLIEISGPMFMSYAVAGHLQFRLTPIAGGVELSLRHQVLGAVKDEHRVGVSAGWGKILADVKQLAQSQGN